MQRVVDPPSGSSRLWLRASVVLLLAAVVVVLVLLGIWSSVRPPSYRRFVSPPLPDGSRYTFLYPAHLENMAQGAGGSPEVRSSVSVYTANQSLSEWDVLRKRVGFRVPSPGENVTVVVIPLKRAPRSSDRRSQRLAGGGRLRHNEYLIDARTKTQLNLYHDCPADAAAQFDAHNPTIVRSFQLLPPGVEPAP